MSAAGNVERFWWRCPRVIEQLMQEEYAVEKIIVKKTK